MQKKWFRRKIYGYGWYPSTWQGWLMTTVYLAVVILLAQTADRYHSNGQIFTYVVLPQIAVATIYLYAVYKTGEKPRWQWGEQKK